MIDRHVLLHATGRANRLARWCLLGLLVLTLGLNLALVVADAQLAGEALLTGTAGQSDRVVLAAAAGPGRTLIATRDNTVLLIDASGATIAQMAFPKVVGAIVANGDGSRVVVGTADGIVTELDGSLATISTIQVEGRVVGLALADDGGLFVGYGVGTSGGRYFVGFVPTPGVAVSATAQLTFTLSALTALGNNAVYGTADSRVGLLQPGQTAPAWESTLRSPITRLLGIPGPGQILAGGDDGALALLDGQGTTLWTGSTGQYPVRGLAYDLDSDHAFAGNSRGTLTAFDASGTQLISQPATDGDLEAMLPAPDGSSFLVVPRKGGWQTLHPDALSAAQTSNRISSLRLVLNGLLAAAFVIAIVTAVEPWRVSSVRTLRAAVKARVAYVFLLPAIALIGAFAYYPTGLAFYYSLTSFSLSNVREFVGLDNYREVIFHDRYFHTGFENMVLIVGTSILKTLTIPLLVAELVFWVRNSFHQYLFRTLFVLPAVVPDLVFTLMWRQVYDPNTGLLNQLLASMGLGNLQRAWLGDEDTAIWAIVGVGFPFVSAFAFLIFLGGLLSINAEYFDAAKVDGARWWQRFLHMDVPLLLPQVRILLFFAIVGAVQGFASVFILTKGGPGTATYVPALQMYLRIGEGDFGYASAIGMVLFAMILVLTLIVLRFRRNDAVEVGAA